MQLRSLSQIGAGWPGGLGSCQYMGVSSCRSEDRNSFHRWGSITDGVSSCFSTGWCGMERRGRWGAWGRGSKAGCSVALFCSQEPLPLRAGGSLQVSAIHKHTCTISMHRRVCTQVHTCAQQACRDGDAHTCTINMHRWVCTRMHTHAHIRFLSLLPSLLYMLFYPNFLLSEDLIPTSNLKGHRILETPQRAG